MKIILIRVDKFDNSLCGSNCRFLARELRGNRCALFDVVIGEDFERCSRCCEMISEGDSLKVEFVTEASREYL